MIYDKKYDVIVIGGGHAGTEACLAAARMGLSTLLLTHNIETLGQMSCNPAIGGIGKGHLVKEIDAMGGLMAEAADHAGIQFRVLNASKGPAVRATRAQIDRVLYRNYVRKFLCNQPNLDIFQQEVVDIKLDEHDQVQSVVTKIGLEFLCTTAVLTAGTFLGGKIHVGMENYTGGRAGDPASISLAERLRGLNLRVGRLKTGTPPRIDSRTIDFSKLKTQPGDTELPVFSFMGKVSDHPEQVMCYMTYTNETTHEVIRANLDRSPMYQGVIKGVGPRYCPSIEDKVVRFADKNQHQIFLEPEGLDSTEFYPNGVSTSLPFDVQVKIINSMPGLEHARIMRPGYAIEYDYFDPRDLYKSLESKNIKNLFLAGQINGTTGYEEAAAQGLLAGMNAGLRCQGRDTWKPSRNQAYLGVLVDDLTTLGTNEPYRLFTSRAEYRLLLREDNADMRLTAIAHDFGLVSEARFSTYQQKLALIDSETARISEIWVHPSVDNIAAINALLDAPLTKEANGLELLRRPDMSYAKLVQIAQYAQGALIGEYADTNIPAMIREQAAQQIEIKAKYSGYIDRQVEEIEKIRRNEETVIPVDFSYRAIPSLSNEVVAKLEDHRPETIGQASRISGITPAAISALMVYIKKYNQEHGSTLPGGIPRQ